MRFKRFYLSETPAAYDDETTKKIGKRDDVTGTIWGEWPDEDASVAQVAKWVYDSIDNDILKDQFLGSGASRKVEFNDGKTVFKYNHDVEKFGNQTKVENEIYKKWGVKYKKFLPKIFKSGDNWQIIEFIDCKFTPEKFEKATGISFESWDRFTHLLNFRKLKDLYKENDNSVEKALNTVPAEIVKVILSSKVIMEILDMCMITGINYFDFHKFNLGFKDGNLVIIDYGFGHNTST